MTDEETLKRIKKSYDKYKDTLSPKVQHVLPDDSIEEPYIPLEERMDTEPEEEERHPVSWKPDTWLDSLSVREFDTGATRDTDNGKLDYEGFFSPLVLQRRAEYMHKHRVQSDGTLRASDNWQKGIPLDEYMKSAFRHFMEWWSVHREDGDVGEAICALMFNCEGYLHEVLKGNDVRP